MSCTTLNLVVLSSACSSRCAASLLSSNNDLSCFSMLPGVSIIMTSGISSLSAYGIDVRIAVLTDANVSLYKFVMFVGGLYLSISHPASAIVQKAVSAANHSM